MLLEINDLHVSVQDTEIIKGLNLNIGAGEVVPSLARRLRDS